MTKRVMFLYWGRRGLSRFVYEMADAALAAEPATSISVSRHIENFAAFDRIGPRLFAVDAFASNLGAISLPWKLPALYRALRQRLRDDNIDTVVEMMPHVWSTLILSYARRTGVRYATIIHDADPHPGDWKTAALSRIVAMAAGNADVVLTLSEAVSDRLKQKHPNLRGRVHTLFHPDLQFAGPSLRQPRQHGEPLRLLWLGRVLPYKGLGLFVETVERLRRDNANIEVGVFGEGDLGDVAPRLASLGCEVVNRWLSDDEIAAVLGRHDVMVLSHIESSQSGIAATALGAGLPLVVTPVGGLIEQVENERTGLVASAVTADGLADQVARLLDDRALYDAICRNISDQRAARSMAAFCAACLASVA